MEKYQKGDYRYREKDGVFAVVCNLIAVFFAWIADKINGKQDGKAFYISVPSGPNRHERRMEAKKTRTVFKLKGTPGFKLIRRMFCKYGVESTVKLMQGTFQLKSKAIAQTAFYRALNKTYGNKFAKA